MSRQKQPKCHDIKKDLVMSRHHWCSGAQFVKGWVYWLVGWLLCREVSKWVGGYVGMKVGRQKGR